MERVLFEYYLDPTTWVYLSSLMTIGIYFKFRRFWSVRNLDLLGLITFAPGLLLIARSDERLQRLGYIWLTVVGVAYLIRLLIDPLMVRRPLLEPNLSVDGLMFTGVALLVFLVANVVMTQLLESDREGARRMDMILAGKMTFDELQNTKQIEPGYPLFHVFATFSNTTLAPDTAAEAVPLPRRELVRAVATRGSVILGHLAIVIGIVLIGYRHFDNLHTGMAVAALYLLLPYTSQMTSRVDHVVPAALLVWAVEAYRRPVMAGLFLGLAGGLIGYPLFLLPLWCSFYAQRGLVRFLLGVVAALALLVATLARVSPDSASFFYHLGTMFGVNAWRIETTAGLWKFHEAVYRIPVVVAFVAGCLAFVLWPPQKNLGTLLSCSAAVMLAVTFWYDPTSGVYHMAWFLPLLLLTIFRPNLEDRVASVAVTEVRWFRRAAPGA
ncbi:MAG TPA: hypothetical protein VJL29_04755 [Thermoguttaceae bacterium]|nr:hypothetical protein [Thermoguttaceae bacterium]